LGDLHGNTSDGIHVASTGGVWAALVYGFGGMRDHGDIMRFDPRLPEQWDSLTFRITQRATRIRVNITQSEITFTVEVGPGLTVDVRGETVAVTRKAPSTVALAHQGPRIPGGPHAEAVHGSVREDGS